MEERSNCYTQKLFGYWYRIVFLIVLVFITNFPVYAQEQDEPENLHVFWKWIRWNNPGSFIIDHYIHQADKLYEQRSNAIAKLETKKD